VHLPSQLVHSVNESGQALGQVNGLHALSQDGGEIRIEVGSGTYQFDVRTGENQAGPGV
jgi:hypothetical protein